MRKDSKKASKGKRTKKAAVKDLSPKDAKSVKGGFQDIHFTARVNKASPTL